MANEHKFLSSLRDQVKAFTEADPFFDGIDILNEELKDILNAVDQRIAQLGGLCIVLVTPSVGGVIANVSGANFSDIKLVARIYENTIINDTGKHALDVAMYLAALWSQARPDTFSSALVPSEPTVQLGNDPNYLSYDVIFGTESGASIPIPQLETPGADLTDLDAVVLAAELQTEPGDVADLGDTGPISEAALSHTRPGVALYYTTDGSYPHPRNSSAALYTEPFTLAPGDKLRVRAWLAGFLPSLELRATAAA
jgi:hypothetical protein